MNPPLLTIVVPCYNEEDVLPETIDRLTDVLRQLLDEALISVKSKLLLVDDGSKDRTWALIFRACRENEFVTGLKLARNFGHQKALLAGLSIAAQKADCVISLDADLQDDIGVIRDFVTAYLEGYDIVYGVRRSRDSDTIFKRATAQGFYRFMRKMGMNVIDNHADYRLLSKRALRELLRFKETNLFLRGIVPLVGFRSAIVYYDRKKRMSGESKYPLKKMLAFALDGITSFTVKPIRFITTIGFVASLVSVIAGTYALISKWTGTTQSGWTSLMISLWLIGGLLLLSIGLIGEYIGKIYEEVKQRPRFIIEEDLFSERIFDRSAVPDRL